MLERNGREYAMREKCLFYIFKLAQQSISTNRGAESNIYMTVLLYMSRVGHRLMTIILPNRGRFKKKIIRRFLGKFAVKWLFKTHRTLRVLLYTAL